LYLERISLQGAGFAGMSVEFNRYRSPGDFRGVDTGIPQPSESCRKNGGLSKNAGNPAQKTDPFRKT
jgi:hypothetical protein